ncbi:hypothetical protein VTK56DRAFT_3625 [Thermocarpiscus australiensis]
MGKPTASRSSASGSSSNDGDVLSLHTQPGGRAFINDVPKLPSDDLPPLYSDVEPDSNSNAHLLPTSQSAYVLPALQGGFHQTDANTGVEFIMHPRLDNDPKLLEQQIQLSAKKPLRPSIRILGTHRQTVHVNGKSEKKTVTDFDVSVDLTPYLFSDATSGLSSRQLRTVENSEKTRRGTILRKRAPSAERDLELSANSKPTLAEWCHRYCASHAGLKCFVLRRQMLGFDEEKMKVKLEALVRGTNYHGAVTITFPVKDGSVVVYKDCRVNRWRLTPWIVWMCYLTFLWIFTWPYLFFRTKMFEVAVAEWPFSVTESNGRIKRYVSMSEDYVYNTWARAISRAVLDKRHCVIDQKDLIASQTPGTPFGNGLEGAPSFLRAGVNAITAVNRNFGWGADSF